MAGPDRLGRMLIATIANPAVDPIVMPGQAILNTRRPVEELDEDFAALDLERIGVVAELREAVADVMAARLRHAEVSERDEPVPSEVRVDTSRERLRLLGDPFVSVDTARLRSWVAGQREVALVGGEAA